MRKTILSVMALEALADTDSFTIGDAFDIDFEQGDCHLSIKNTSTKNMVFESSDDLV